MVHFSNCHCGVYVLSKYLTTLNLQITKTSLVQAKFNDKHSFSIIEL